MDHEVPSRRGVPIRRILHLIQHWMQAGVSEDGRRSETKVVPLPKNGSRMLAPWLYGSTRFEIARRGQAVEGISPGRRT